MLTDRRRRQAPFPEAGDRYRTSYVDSPIGLALLTPSGEVFHANPALCRLVATTEAALLGTPFTTHVVVDDLATADATLAIDPARDGEPRSCSLRLEVRGGGWSWADITARTVHDRAGDPLFVVVHIEDRTAEVEAVAALSDAERAALAGRLASGVIHDVRNALTALQGRVELLAADLDDEGAARSHLDSMHAAMSRMNSLTCQVLDLARPSAADRELVDLAGIVSTFEPVARAQFDDRDRVVVEAAEPVLLEVDPAQVERVLLTLFSNAVDAVAVGGAIRIAVSVAPRPSADGGPQALLVVEDTGVGMDEAMAARAFEPFFSTKGRNGFGLGLASAQAVVRSLGGTITIGSQRGRGTSVEVLLPGVVLLDDPAV